MANETMRIFFPLKIISYPQYDCSEDERKDISPRWLTGIIESRIVFGLPLRHKENQSDTSSLLRIVCPG